MRISDWSSDVCSSDLLGDELRLHRIIDVLRDSPIADPGDQFADYREWRKKPLAWLNSLAESVSGGEIETGRRSEEHTSELQSLMRISYAVFCLKKKKINTILNINIS